MSEHTPGPWEVRGITVIHGKDLVAECSGGFLAGKGIEKARANAQLIAAAPDLLDALDKAADTLAALTAATKLDAKMIETMARDTYGEVLAAIAKAQPRGRDR